MAKDKRAIGWHIAVEPEFSTEMAGTRLGSYFLDTDIAAQTQISCAKKMYEIFGYGSAENISINIPCVYSPYVEASILGTKLVYPEDDMPQIAGRVLKDIKDVRRIRIPDLQKAPFISDAMEKYNYLQKRYESTGIGVSKPNIGGGSSVLSTAISLRGEELFADMVCEPNAVKDLMEIISQLETQLTILDQNIFGIPVNSLGFEDDFGGLISPDLHEEMVLPYMKKMCRQFPAKTRSIHSETYSRRHLKLLKALEITHYDAWPYRNSLAIQDILEELPDVPFDWNFETVKDLVYGTPENIREKYRACAREGAKGMALNICTRKAKLENIRAFIEVAKEFE